MENLDIQLFFMPEKCTVLNVEMEYSSFRLKEVAVVAQESKGLKLLLQIYPDKRWTTYKQVAFYIMQLLPGGVTANPNASTAKTISIRNSGGTANEMS